MTTDLMPASKPAPFNARTGPKDKVDAALRAIERDVRLRHRTDRAERDGAALAARYAKESI